MVKKMVEKRKKRYYSISEVADLAGVKAHILRYWEGEFPRLRPRKNRAGNRAYIERDLKIVLLIKKLLYEERFTIEGAKKHMKSARDEINAQQIEISFDKIKKRNEIKEIRKELLELINIVKAI